VPFLAGYLFWKRWSDRPAPAASEWKYNFGAAFILAASALPLRLLLEANPDWRILLWADVLLLVGAILVGLRSIGGRSWWTHFFIPVSFLLLAAPWPARVERFIIENLTRDIAAATVETMNWLGIPALLRGNIIDLRSASLGVSEACSGIRSVQTVLMSAIFFGELYRLAAVRRFLLIGIALAGTIFLNFVRTALLTWIAATHGIRKEALWHDRVGLFALIVSIALTCGVSILFSRKKTILESQRRESGEHSHLPRFLSCRTACLILVWLVAVECLNEFWFRSRESKGGAKINWTVSWPAPAAGFVRQDLSDDVLSILRCDRGDSGVWRRPDGSVWTMYFIKWGSGRMAAKLARGHTPDVCMTGNGFRMVADLGLAVITLPNIKLPFETYQFEANGKPWFVFFCLDEERVSMPASLSSARNDYISELEPRNRLRAVRDGKRFYGQQVFEIAISGYDSAKTALAALEKALPDLVNVQMP
jgi:exosortase